jgi:hypothetical protein
MSGLAIAAVVLFVGTASVQVRGGTRGCAGTQTNPSGPPANTAPTNNGKATGTTPGNATTGRATSSPNQGTTIPTVTGNPTDLPGTGRGAASPPAPGGAAPPAQGTSGAAGTTPPAGQTQGGEQQATPTPGNTPSAPKAAQTPTPPRLYMPDGQLTSHLINVYVDRDVQESQHPQLLLSRSHALTKEATREDDPIDVYRAAPAHWHENDNGTDISQTGTLLLFRLKDGRLGGKAIVRVRPIVTWDGGKAVGDHEVNLGDIVVASGWTTVIVALALALVLLLARKKEGGSIGFLRGVDGHLSLGQSQMACWTIAIGGVVLGYGLIRLEIPTIPGSLLALMGASMVTGGVAFFQDGQNLKAAQAAAAAGAGGGAADVGPGGGALAANAGQPTAAPAPAAPQLTTRDWSWGDLVRTFTGPQAGALSLAKAQMIFWTVLLLVLFVSKSILDGVIWDIPWALVALMGFSQAGYLAPKLTPQ